MSTAPRERAAPPASSSVEERAHQTESSLAALSLRLDHALIGALTAERDRARADLARTEARLLAVKADHARCVEQLVQVRRALDALRAERAASQQLRATLEALIAGRTQAEPLRAEHGPVAVVLATLYRERAERAEAERVRAVARAERAEAALRARPQAPQDTPAPAAEDHRP